MKTLLAAAGVFAFSTGAAFAQSSMLQDDGYGYAPEDSGVTAYEEIYSPSEGTNYQFHGFGSSTAPGFYPQNATQAQDWTPNMGAGTSRSSSANSG